LFSLRRKKHTLFTPLHFLGSLPVHKTKVFAQNFLLKRNYLHRLFRWSEGGFWGFQEVVIKVDYIWKRQKRSFPSRIPEFSDVMREFGRLQEYTFCRDVKTGCTTVVVVELARFWFRICYFHTYFYK